MHLCCDGKQAMEAVVKSKVLCRQVNDFSASIFDAVQAVLEAFVKCFGASHDHRRVELTGHTEVLKCYPNILGIFDAAKMLVHGSDSTCSNSMCRPVQSWSCASCSNSNTRCSSS